MNTILLNRLEAGQKLAEKLVAYHNRSETIVFGMPREGVVVAFELAKALNLPLDVCLVASLYNPNNQNQIFGAVAEQALMPDYSGKIPIINEDKNQTSKLDLQSVQVIAARAKAELVWRDRTYRHFRPLKQIRNQSVILVDDQIVRGSNIQAAVKVLQRHQPCSITIAATVISGLILPKLTSSVDQIVYLYAPAIDNKVNYRYENSTPATDQTVCDLLSQTTTKQTVFC